MSELAHESGPGFFDRIWPWFLGLAALVFLAALLIGLRGDKKGEGGDGRGGAPDD